MYADDHQVYQSGSDITAIISELTNEAKFVSRWYQANLLHANPKMLLKFHCLNILNLN